MTNGDSTTPASSVRVTSWLLVLHSMTSLALVALVAATVARGGGWYPPTSTTFLFPWAITLGDTGAFGFWSMVIFLGVLTIGFIYEWKKGALEWE